MQVQVWQAALFGLLACLASMPGLGGTVLGNYTLGRPLVAGLIVGLIMGDVQTGIYLGAAIQVVYIALVTPGGTVFPLTFARSLTSAFRFPWLRYIPWV